MHLIPWTLSFETSTQQLHGKPSFETSQSRPLPVRFNSNFVALPALTQTYEAKISSVDIPHFRNVKTLVRPIR